MLPGIRKRLGGTINKEGTLDVGQGLDGVAWLTNKMARASGPEYKPLFKALTRVMNTTANLVHKEDDMSVKFELGITVGEITAMLPAILSEAWEHYSDDKRISVEEGLQIVGVILGEMADAADAEEVSNLFLSIQDTLESIAPFVAEDVTPVE